MPGRSPTPSPFEVLEGARIDLVDDAALPPRMLLRHGDSHPGAGGNRPERREFPRHPIDIVGLAWPEEPERNTRLR